MSLFGIADGSDEKSWWSRLFPYCSSSLSQGAHRPDAVDNQRRYAMRQVHRRQHQIVQKLMEETSLISTGDDQKATQPTADPSSSGALFCVSANRLTNRSAPGSGGGGSMAPADHRPSFVRRGETSARRLSDPAGLWRGRRDEPKELDLLSGSPPRASRSGQILCDYYDAPRPPRHKKEPAKIERRKSGERIPPCNPKVCARRSIYI